MPHRPFLVIFVLLAAALPVARTNAEPPARGRLDDLNSDAIAVLKASDGVARVERPVAVDRPKHRIVHILDLHAVSVDRLAVDLRDQDPNISYADIEAEYRAAMDTARRVQRGQRALIRSLAKDNGVHRVYVEGLTDGNLKAYMAFVRAFHRCADRMPPQLGAAAQALAAGELEGVAPVEDEAAYRKADPIAGDRVTFEGAANDAREAAIVRRLVASGPLSVVVLGEAHDLSRHVRALGGCEYLRVFVEGLPE